MKYFNDNGNVKGDRAVLYSLFDSDGSLNLSVYEEVMENYNKFPADSEIACFYWCNQAASETHGNYDPETLICRCCDFIESRKN